MTVDDLEKLMFSFLLDSNFDSHYTFVSDKFISDFDAKYQQSKFSSNQNCLAYNLDSINMIVVIYCKMTPPEMIIRRKVPI